MSGFGFTVLNLLGVMFKLCYNMLVGDRLELCCGDWLLIVGFGIGWVFVLLIVWCLFVIDFTCRLIMLLSLLFSGLYNLGFVCFTDVGIVGFRLLVILFRFGFCLFGCCCYLAGDVLIIMKACGWWVIMCWF